MGVIAAENVDPNLIPGAENAIGTCLAIQQGERVALIFDEPSREVAASLGYALTQHGAEWTGYCVEDFAPRPLTGAPAEILRALETADAGILCFQPLLGELAARKDIVGVVERRRLVAGQQHLRHFQSTPIGRPGVGRPLQHTIGM